MPSISASNLGISQHHLKLNRISRRQKTKLSYDFKRGEIYALKSEFASVRRDICSSFEGINDGSWVWETLNIIQVSPEGGVEVNSGGYIPRREA